MMFRMLYWVTEQVEPGSCPQVTGVYTSIQDLVKSGIRWIQPMNGSGQFRLTLVKLDSDKGPLGAWQSPQFEGLEEDMEEYVRTDEFRVEEIKRLVAALEAFSSVGK